MYVSIFDCFEPMDVSRESNIARPADMPSKGDFKKAVADTHLRERV